MGWGANAFQFWNRGNKLEYLELIYIFSWIQIKLVRITNCILFIFAFFFLSFLLLLLLLLYNCLLAKLLKPWQIWRPHPARDGGVTNLSTGSQPLPICETCCATLLQWPVWKLASVKHQMRAFLLLAVGRRVRNPGGGRGVWPRDFAMQKSRQPSILAVANLRRFEWED